MSALATFRTNILALLDDAALARFTNAQVDAALRWALNTYDLYRPYIATYNLDCDGNSIMELPSDFSAFKIIKAELYADDVDDWIEITFYAWKTDEAWFIQTIDTIYSAGEVLVLTYATPNTIDDLDSATTIPAEDEHLLQVGAAGFGAFVAGTPGENDMPGKLLFYTTPDGSSTVTVDLVINSEQMVLCAKGLHVGSTSGSPTDNDINCDGTIETASQDEWDLNDYTAGAPAATGYVTVTINGVTYKLLANKP